MCLAGWFSWLEHRPGHRTVAGSIPGWGAREATCQCFSLTSFSLPLKSIKTYPWVRIEKEKRMTMKLLHERAWRRGVSEAHVGLPVWTGWDTLSQE